MALVYTKQELFLQIWLKERIKIVLFKKRLKQLRIKYNLNQKDIANLLGVGITTISNYEMGRNEPCMEKLITLAQFFNVSLDYLIGNSENEILKKEKNQELNLSNEALNLFSDALKLYDSNIAAFNNVIMLLLIETNKI